MQRTTRCFGFFNGSSAGGILNSGTLNLTDVEVRDNSANGTGGGILHDGSALTLTRVTLAGNQALDGGGLYADTGGVLLQGVTVSGNGASGRSSPNTGFSAAVCQAADLEAGRQQRQQVVEMPLELVHAPGAPGPEPWPGLRSAPAGPLHRPRGRCCCPR